MALRGVRVLEFAGLAPGPFCGMMLADLGASVTRIDRPKGTSIDYDVLARGKRSICVDLKRGTSVIHRLVSGADVVIEPYRRGVMEKLGLGPDDLLKRNPSLIYARLTGYGQFGPYADKAGHDINYLALSGVLSRLGRKGQPPAPPVNLLADFAGGGLMCAFGIMAALLERHRTGSGQVIDANMVEGAAYVSSWLFKSQEMFVWGKPRGENFLDTGTHFYETYETSDGKFMAVGALEPQFYQHLLLGLGLDQDEVPQMGDFDELKAKLRQKFLEKTREEWTEIFQKLDACVTPVLDLDEAPDFHHNKERKSFMKNEKGGFDPIPAPRLQTYSDDIVSRRSPSVGGDAVQVLTEAGFSQEEVRELLKRGVVGVAEEDNDTELKSKL